MKKSSDRSNVGSAGNDRIGGLLATTLKQSQRQACPSLEEIAALIDGNLDANARDRIMGHLATCDRCYDVFLMTSGLSERKIIPMKRAFFSHPIRLAASVIIAIFSLFVFYKIVFISGVSDQPKINFGSGDEAASPLSREEYKEEKREKGQSIPATIGKHETGQVEKKPVKFLQKDDIPAGKVAKKSTPVKLKPGIAAKKGVEKKAVVGGVKRREVTTGRDVEQQVEEQQDLQQYRNVNQKEQVRQDTPRQDSQMLQQQTIPRQQQSEREQKAIVQQQYDRQAQEIDRQKSAFPEKAALSDKRKKGQARGSARGKSAEVAAQTAGIKPGPWSDFDRLNNELSQYKTYIPQDKIEDLFYTASNLAGKLENEFRGQGENCFAIDGAKLQELPGKKLLPVMNIESRQGIVFIMPHIRYFLEKSEPGTRAYRFFNLALSGWCDGRGCYGAIKGEIEKERRDELLSKWQALKPELRGIFLKMAGRTIHHLKK